MIIVLVNNSKVFTIYILAIHFSYISIKDRFHKKKEYSEKVFFLLSLSPAICWSTPFDFRLDIQVYIFTQRTLLSSIPSDIQVYLKLPLLYHNFIVDLTLYFLLCLGNNQLKFVCAIYVLSIQDYVQYFSRLLFDTYEEYVI